MRIEILAMANDDGGEFVVRICEAKGEVVDLVPESGWREVAETLGRRLPPKALRALYDRFGTAGLLKHATEIARAEGRASIRLFQQKLHIGWLRSLRLLRTLQDEGVVAPGELPPRGNGGWIGLVERDVDG